MATRHALFEPKTKAVIAAIQPENRLLYHGTNSEEDFDVLKPGADGVIWLGEFHTAGHYATTHYRKGDPRIFEVKLRQSARILDLRDLSDVRTQKVRDRFVAQRRATWGSQYSIPDESWPKMADFGVVNREMATYLRSMKVDAVIVNDLSDGMGGHDSLGVLNKKIITKVTPVAPQTKQASSDAVQNVLNALHESYEPDPQDPKQRVVNIGGIRVGDFELDEREGRLRIRSIQSNKPNNGIGSLILRRILRAADREGVTVELTASPKGHQALDGDKLKQWYGRYGFVEEPGYDPALGYMIREPQSKTAAAIKPLSQSDIDHWASYSRNMDFKSEQEARDWVFRQMERNDEQHGDLFGRIGPEGNRARANEMPVRRERGNKWKIGPKPRIEVSKERLGSEEPVGKHPQVDWYKRDNQDDGPVTEEMLLANYNYPEGKKAIVYQSWVPVSDLPEPKLAEQEDDHDEDDPDYSAYDWESLRMSWKHGIPPAKLMVRSNGQVVIMDGNHRIKFWVEQDCDSIPAWVIDQRRGIKTDRHESKLAAPLHEEGRSRVYYHGTSSDAAAQAIIHDGIQSREISMPDKAKSRGALAPARGRVYITPSLEYAAIYALGASMFGSKPDQLERFLTDRYGNPDPYGYLFAINGENIEGDVVPDEDSIGELITDVLTGGTYRAINLPENVRARTSLMEIADRVMTAPQRSKIRMGFIDAQAAVGKKVQKHLQPWLIQWMLDHGAHAAHQGVCHPTKAWRFKKIDASSIMAKDVLSICEEVPLPVNKTADYNRDAWKTDFKQYQGDWNKDFTQEQWKEQSHRSKEWGQSVLAALSEGKLTPSEAYKQNLHTGLTSVEIRDFKPLPPRLFHVSTAASKIKQEGLMSRWELSMASGTGLGGGDDHSISFTTDRDTAEAIYWSLKTARRVARGDMTIAEMIDSATKGEGADRPWINEIVKSLGGEQLEDGTSLEIDRMVRGKKISERGTSIGNPPEGEGWEPAERYGSWIDGQGKKRYRYYERDMTEAEQQEARFRFFKKWSAFREHAGGALDPLYFCTDVPALAKVPEEEIAILEYRAVPGAMGTEVRALGEWRTYSGKAVVLAGEQQPKQAGAIKYRIYTRGSSGFDVVALNGKYEVGKLQIDYRSPESATVMAVDVDEEHQRKGIALKMYELAKKELKFKGIKTLNGALEGSGPVQIRERVFGPGNTTYSDGGEDPVSTEEAIKVMDVDYGRLRAESKISKVCVACESGDCFSHQASATLKINVPREEHAGFWERPPEGHEAFWAFRVVPKISGRVLAAGDTLLFHMEGRAVATAVVSRVENPGKQACAATGRFRDRYKVYWVPESLRRLAASEPLDITKTPAFKQWFGNSKMVNPDGTPMKFYHGTTGDFDTFDVSNAGQVQTSDWGKGIYLTPSPVSADYYRGYGAKAKDEKANKLWEQIEELEKQVVWSDPKYRSGTPTYPAGHSELMEEYREARREAEDKSGIVMPLYAKIENPYYQEYSSMTDPYLAERAQSSGHDGVVVLSGDGESIDEVLVFSPSQVKSALGNSGEFNSENLSILAAKGHIGPPPPITWIMPDSDRWNPDILRVNYISLADIRSSQRYRNRKIVAEYVDHILAGKPLDCMTVRRVADHHYDFYGPGGNHRLSAMKKLGYTNEIVPVHEEAPIGGWVDEPNPPPAGLKTAAGKDGAKIGSSWQPNEAQLATLKDIDSRVGDDFKEWLDDLIGPDGELTVDEVLNSEKDRLIYLDDYLQEKYGVGVEEHGYCTFYHLTPAVEQLIGDLPVVVYHHTSTAILPKVKREGLRADVKRINTHDNSGSGVYVTTELSGPAVEGYHAHALKGHGRRGREVTLSIKTYLADLIQDPDDADLSSGAHQFILPYVAPGDILWDEPKTKIKRPGNEKVLQNGGTSVLKPGLSYGDPISVGQIRGGDELEGDDFGGTVQSVTGKGDQAIYVIEEKPGEWVQKTGLELRSGRTLVRRGDTIHVVKQLGKQATDAESGTEVTTSCTMVSGGQGTELVKSGAMATTLISITASPAVARFDGMVFRYWNNDHTPPHIHVEIDRQKYRFTVPDGVAMDKGTPNQVIKKVKRWFETVVPGTDRRVGELVYDEYLHAHHHQPVGQVPTPDQIKVMKRPSKEEPKEANPKKARQRWKNYYAIDHLEVLDNHRLKIWFENGDVKIVDVRNALGEEPDSPYFAELFENFDKAENIYFGVSWPWPSSNNTYDIKDEDLWGAGVDVSAFERDKQAALKSSQYPAVLEDRRAIAQYIASLASDDVDEEFIEEYYVGMAAVLREVPINSIREGDPDHNISSKAKERRYKKMDLATMPPIVVQDGVIEDGNHRYRVAKSLGAKTIWCYVVVDEAEVEPKKPEKRKAAESSFEDDMARFADQYDPDETDLGDVWERVIWNRQSVIPTTKLDRVGLATSGDEFPSLRAVHVGDPDFWFGRLVADYDRAPRAWVIEIKTVEGDVVVDDVQNAIPDQSGQKGDSMILVTRRTELREGVDFTYTKTLGKKDLPKQDSYAAP